MYESKNFGIEVEFTGVTRETVIKHFELFFRRKSICEHKILKDNSEYDKYMIQDDDGLVWTLNRDRSLVAEIFTPDFEIKSVNEEDVDGLYKCELVSPVLNAKSVGTLCSLVDIIKSLGGIVNDSCGIHVHIDKPDSVDEVLDLIQKFTAIQTYIFEDFQVKENRLLKYCKPYPQSFINGLSVYDINTFEDLRDYVQRHLGGDYPLTHSHNISRYYALNLHSLVMHNTIEFRFFNGSLDTKEIKRILDWVLHFSYSPEKYEDYSDKLGL